MGKPKTQRTEALHNAARRYTLAKQAEQAIEQHNLDKLVRSGVIMTEPTGNEYKPRRLTMKDIMDVKMAIEQEYAGGASGKALPPKGAGGA